METIPLKPEKFDKRVAAAVTSEVKGQLQEYCAENDVTESRAILHILSLFLAEYSRKTRAKSSIEAAEVESELELVR